MTFLRASLRKCAGLILNRDKRLWRALHTLTALFLFCLGCTLVFGTDNIAKKVQRASYDWLYKLPFVYRPSVTDSGVVMVYVDELSQERLAQPSNGPWDRSLYADLLKRLHRDGARAVVLDVIFSGDSNPAADQELAEAIEQNGRVVLGVDMVPATHGLEGNPSAEISMMVYPHEQFAKHAGALGLAHLNADDDFLIREHLHITSEDRLASLPWAAAQMLDLPVTQQPNAVLKERWVRYYGGPKTLPHVSFSTALEPASLPAGFFKNKIVFVGAQPVTSFLIERRDEYRNSFSKWDDKFIFMPAVEVHATIFLNLVRGDWITRLPPAVELFAVALIALAGGLGLTRLKPASATLVALVGQLLFTIVAMLLFSVAGYWTAWFAIVLAMVPAALVLSMSFNSLEWFVQKRKHELEKRAAAQQIYEQAALLDKAQDAIFAYDLDWNVSFWNEGAHRAYGWSREEVRGKNARELLAHDGPSMLAAREEALKHGEWMGELKHVTRAGIEVLMQSRWSLMRDDDGNPKAILAINTDITEKRALETQILRSQRLDSLGTLAGGIAHDLNNVLAPILMGVELMRMKGAGPNDRMLNTIENSAKRGADLVKQVLTFARGVDGEQRVIEVRHLLKEMDKILNETFPKSINISFQVGANLKPVSADVTQLHQVLLNLCVNARDAMMPQGGRLRVEATNVQVNASSPAFLRGSPHQNFVLVKVSDSGSGIPPEIAEKIFEPFFTTKEVGKGTGLGLATVVSIVRKHKGFLDFKSVVGEGTEFHVYLPASESEVSIESEKQRIDSARGQGELILVVDDEPLLRNAVEEMLTISNYQVITASHAQSALEIVAEKRGEIALVLMDRMMPGMDSLQAMSEIKLLQPQTPIICMSGLAPNERGDLDAVTEAFLQKPFSREKLLSLIAETRSRCAAKARQDALLPA